MRWAIVGITMLLAGAADPKPETVSKTGKVVPLAAALKTLGIPSDAGPIAQQVVLVEPDGTITPLLSDESSRAFFLDERLRDRKAELSARKFPGLPYLQVVAFKVEEGGVLRIPEYYCDICTISVRYPQICPCCQGPMELRMKPEAR
jgi:hypothetical protein